jgi:hypothetical protein
MSYLSFLKDIVVPIVAVCSLLLNAYMAFLLRQRRPYVSRIGELREALRAFTNACESSRVLTVEPHYELWGMGFESLATIRNAAVECSELYTLAPENLVPTMIKSIVARLRAHAEDLYRFRDSFTRFSKGKLITSDSEIAKWGDFERAKHALSVLQNDFRSQKDELKAFLSRLDAF